jgi:hypothetical protein
MAPPASAPDESKPERKGRIIAGVLVICVALLSAAFGGLFLVSKLFNGGATFAIGDCVKQSDTAAVKADCGEPGAFKIIASVSNPEQCQDQTQPHVQQGQKILCLVPASGTQVTPTTTPQTTSAPAAGSTAKPTATAPK